MTYVIFYILAYFFRILHKKHQKSRPSRKKITQNFHHRQYITGKASNILQNNKSKHKILRKNRHMKFTKMPSPAQREGKCDIVAQGGIDNVKQQNKKRYSMSISQTVKKILTVCSLFTGCSKSPKARHNFYAEKRGLLPVNELFRMKI